MNRNSHLFTVCILVRNGIDITEEIKILKKSGYIKIKNQPGN